MNNTRFLPCFFDGDEQHVPALLRAFHRYPLPGRMEDLYRYLTGQPKVVPAPLGTIREMPPLHIGGRPQQDVSLSLQALQAYTTDLPAGRGGRRVAIGPATALNKSKRELEEILLQSSVELAHAGRIEFPFRLSGANARRDRLHDSIAGRLGSPPFWNYLFTTGCCLASERAFREDQRALDGVNGKYIAVFESMYCIAEAALFAEKAQRMISPDTPWVVVFVWSGLEGRRLGMDDSRRSMFNFMMRHKPPGSVDEWRYELEVVPVSLEKRVEKLLESSCDALADLYWSMGWDRGDNSETMSDFREVMTNYLPSADSAPEREAGD